MAGNVPIPLGNYQLSADEDLSELQVKQGKRVIATVVCYWKDLPRKASDSEVKIGEKRVTDVQFKGRSEAILFFP